MATLNLTCDWQGDYPVMLDPDLAGIGVISALLAVVSIFLAYMTESLPETCYNDFDRIIIHNKTGHLRIWKGISKYPRAKRIKAFEQFVLALSDQQLVTGICVVVSALIRIHRTTFADFDIVTALALFSSTVHLVTLMMLRDYFRAYRSRYVLRSVLMGIVLALLIFAIVTQEWGTNGYLGLPLSCIFHTRYVDPVLAISTAGTISLLIILFLSSILTITGQSGELGKAALFGISRWLNNSEARGLLRSPRGRDGFFAFVQSEIEQQTLVAAGIRKVFGNYLLDSFWLQICVVSYLVAYAMTFFIFFYFQDPQLEIPREIGYGQMLPMLLLALPFLSLFESIRNIRDKFLEKNNIIKDKDQLSPNIGPSKKEHGASIKSVALLVLEPTWVHANREFVLKKDEIKKLFPLEYMTLTELEADHLAEMKQALLVRLSRASADRAATEAHSRHFFHFSAFAYAIFLGYWVRTTVWFYGMFAYLPVLLILILLILPYVKAFLSLREGGKSEKKRKLLKLMRLADQAAKEDKSVTEKEHVTKANDSNVVTAIRSTLRRKWTV